MVESVYKVIELIGTSDESWEKAADNAVEKAAKSVRDLRIAEVVEVRFVEFMTQEVIKVRVPYVSRRAATCLIPSGFKRQFAQRMIHQAPQLLHAMRRPGPNLRCSVVDNRNAVLLRTSRNPPVESGEVNQDHSIGALRAEQVIGAPQQAIELG